MNSTAVSDSHATHAHKTSLIPPPPVVEVPPRPLDAVCRVFGAIIRDEVVVRLRTSENEKRYWRFEDSAGQCYRAEFVKAAIARGSVAGLPVWDEDMRLLPPTIRRQIGEDRYSARALVIRAVWEQRDAVYELLDDGHIPGVDADSGKVFAWTAEDEAGYAIGALLDALRAATGMEHVLVYSGHDAPVWFVKLPGLALDVDAPVPYSVVEGSQ